MPNDIPLDGEPADGHDAIATYNQRFQESDLSKLTFYATPGALLRAEVQQWYKENLKTPTMIDVGKGRHALQEDHPHLIGTELVKWYKNL